MGTAGNAMVSARVLAVGEDNVAGPDESQQVEGQFLDQVAMGWFGAQEGDIVRQARPHGLEARDLPLQYQGAFDQSNPRVETVPPVNGMHRKVTKCPAARERDEQLPGAGFTTMLHDMRNAKLCGDG
jgi:hypothetical protein